MKTEKVAADAAAQVINERIDRIVTRIISDANTILERISIKIGHSLKDYYSTAINKYFFIKTVINPSEPIALEDIYVQTDLCNKKKTIKSGSINDLISRSKHIIISGTAGSGKSTLMKYLFLRSFNIGFIPIFFELRNIPFKDEKEFSLNNSLIEYLGKLNLKIGLYTFTQLLNEKAFLLYLDGFDEVPIEYQDLVEKQILDLRDKYRENVIIVSSRKNDRFSSWFNFLELEMNALKKEKAIELVKKINYDEELKSIFISKLQDELFEKHESFVSNPLLLTIMLITFSQFAEIPEKLYLFYQQAYEALFLKHDATKAGFKRKRYCPLTIDDFERVLNGFCFLSYYKHDYSFTHQKIIDFLRDTKKIIHDIDYEEDNFLKDMLSSVCIMIKDGLIYTFSHRSFQEYFAANYLIVAPEDKKQKLFTILSTRIDSDNTMQMVFDMNRQVMEKYFILPQLVEIKELVKDSKNKEIDLILHIFKGIHFTPEDNQFAYGLEISDNRLSSFLMFIYRNYFKSKINSNKEEFATATKELIRLGLKPNNRWPLNELFSDPDKRKLVLIVLKNYMVLLKEVLGLEEHIIKCQQETNSELDQLLNI